MKKPKISPEAWSMLASKMANPVAMYALAILNEIGEMSPTDLTDTVNHVLGLDLEVAVVNTILIRMDGTGIVEKNTLSAKQERLYWVADEWKPILDYLFEIVDGDPIQRGVQYYTERRQRGELFVQRDRSRAPYRPRKKLMAQA